MVTWFVIPLVVGTCVLEKPLNIYLPNERTNRSWNDSNFSAVSWGGRVGAGSFCVLIRTSDVQPSLP